MKSQFQTLTFLAQFRPSSELDRDMITAFIEKRYQITPRTVIFGKETTFPTIDTQSFIQWYKSGYASSEIAIYDNTLAILGQCSQTAVTAIGILEGNQVSSINKPIPVSELSKATEADVLQFQKCLLSSNLQLNPSTLCLEDKYTPQANEKVIFHTYDFATKGIGIIRNIDHSSHKVELYCYFIYPTKTEKARLGYSMHETNIVNQYEYIFEPLLENNDNRFSNDDGISAYRRMKRELEREGKVWKDKIRRIEPSQMRLNKGDTYYYISDKLTVVTEKEKGTPTSQMRYLCGNYFVDDKAAYIMLDKIHELIRNYLASSTWPELSDEQ